MRRTRLRSFETGCSRSSAARPSQARNTVQPVVRNHMFKQSVPEVHLFKGGPMRWFLVLGVALLLSRNSAAQTPSRWTFSAGPEWTRTFGGANFYGGRLRAEYDLLTPTKPFRLRRRPRRFGRRRRVFSPPISMARASTASINHSI